MGHAGYVSIFKLLLLDNFYKTVFKKNKTKRGEIKNENKINKRNKSL